MQHLEPGGTAEADPTAEAGPIKIGAAKATSKLIESDQVDYIIGAGRTGPSLAMRPIADAAQILMISVAANGVVAPMGRLLAADQLAADNPQC